MLKIPAAALFCTFMTSSALAQAGADTTGGAINLGGRGLSSGEVGRPAPSGERKPEKLEFSARGGFASDYIYRGTTLSDHKPVVGAAFEATYSQFYAGFGVMSVKLPSQPAAEISMSGGIRPEFGNIQFDLGATYYLYPGEIPSDVTNGIDYWETVFRAETKLTERVRAAAGFAYSPNISRTGAWGQYAAAGLGYSVPSLSFLPDVGIGITGGAGYSWFGNQTEALGGFPLPAYLNWNTGVTFTRKVFNLNLRYFDTNLTRENCFVFTGDPGARGGGLVDPVRNPDGLASRWCGATFVAKLWFELN